RKWLDARVFDTGEGEQQGDLDVQETIQPLGVAGLELMPRDDQYVIPQPASVKVFEHGEGVRPHRRQERIGGPVEKLERRNVGPEVAVTDERATRLVVRHKSPRLALIPQAVGMADAVGAVQRTALDVIQAQAALAVLDDFAGSVR